MKELPNNETKAKYTKKSHKNLSAKITVDRRMEWRERKRGLHEVLLLPSWYYFHTILSHAGIRWNVV